MDRPLRALDGLAALKNLGPASVGLLREAGVETPDELRRIGSVMAYKLLGRFPERTNLLFLYAMEGALQARHWNSFAPEEKARLKAEADGSLAVAPGTLGEGGA